MQRIIYISMIVLSACSSSGKSNNAVEGSAKPPSDTIPSCIQEKISQFKNEEKQNPPRSIYSYSYNGRTLYYVSAPCCDFFSDLYDSTCNLVAHPDGGFTGRGDGTMPDFMDKRTDEKLIWKDERK